MLLNISCTEKCALQHIKNLEKSYEGNTPKMATNSFNYLFITTILFLLLLNLNIILLALVYHTVSQN